MGTTSAMTAEPTFLGFLQGWGVCSQVQQMTRAHGIIHPFEDEMSDILMNSAKRKGGEGGKQPEASLRPAPSVSSFPVPGPVSSSLLGDCFLLLFQDLISEVNVL